MPIIFDEIAAEILPPTPTTSASENRPDDAPRAGTDPQSLARQLQLLAERAERLNAD